MIDHRLLEFIITILAALLFFLSTSCGVAVVMKYFRWRNYRNRKLMRRKKKTGDFV